MNQKTKSRTLELALLAASLLSSGAVQAFPALPLDFPPPPPYPDIAVNNVSIEFTPGAGINPGKLEVKQTGTFYLDDGTGTGGLPLPDSSYSLIVYTDPDHNNALLSGMLEILDTTAPQHPLLVGSITAFGADGVPNGSGGVLAEFTFLLDVTSSRYQYGPRAAVLLGGDVTSGFPDGAFTGTGNLDNKNVVPEPASLALFAAGGMVLFASKRRHRLESMI